MTTIEDILSDDSGATIIRSSDYGKDELQLVQNAEFQKFANEIPAGYDMKDWDRHSFTMALNEQCRERGFDFQFIGTPRKAMAIVRDLYSKMLDPKLPMAERQAASEKLRGV